MSMLLIGLTGGIASGKTTVSNMFVKLGAHLIDADVIARDVVKPDKPAWKEIVSAFGESVLDDKKEIIREKLAAAIFNSPEKRKQLEAITHPRIIEEENRLINEIRKNNKPGIIILDAALLIEAGHHNRVDKLIVVYLNKNTQIKRLRKRDSLSFADAKKRLDSQMSLNEKVNLANYVIDNGKSTDESEKQVSQIYKKLIMECR
ncbi:MAG: dephospho-CoA kinase [Nitrospinota bacterium]|nr:dephospho-CoA kinase [Nitrospinota bacterium]MDP7580327.1 dephospho-CoA kinase [Nitrospinota bacterium]HJN03252.1 dephospho-CoA kinase [Nitrospinota bacterium]